MRMITRWVGVGAFLVAMPGCYRYVPLETSTPPVGESIAADISDHGRVGLADRLGPGVVRIEGRLQGIEGDALVISVFNVSQISGGSAKWSGETIRLDRNFVDHLRGRELSKKRTWLLVAGVTAGVAALIASRGLEGAFNDNDDPEPGPPRPTNVIARWRIGW